MTHAGDSSVFSLPVWEIAQQWWQAVQIAGYGDIQLAQERMEACVHTADGLPQPDQSIIQSLCWSSQASWLRQQGRHGQAAALDDVAVEAVSEERLSRLHDSQSDADAARGIAEETSAYLRLLALADATSGRAADAIGIPEEGAQVAREWVDRGDDVLVDLRRHIFPQELCSASGEDPSDAEWAHCGLAIPRVVIRHAWVSAEVALSENRPQHALVCSQQSVELAGEWCSPRHLVKSLLVDAASWSALDPRRAEQQAQRAYEEATQAGYRPLQWAALRLLCDLRSHQEDKDQLASVESDLSLRGFQLHDDAGK